MRRRVKHYLGLVLFRTGLYRWLCRRTAVVVVFHRIDDRYPANPITCTSRAFEDFCSFFARYFTVVPLGEVVRRLVEGRSVGGLLAITFDDGYRDNRMTAAPILQSRHLPACFFVTTDYIGSSHVPEWDAAERITSRWMDWGDVRHLADHGFEIGSHTVHHSDLGAVHGADAFRELADSKQRLEAELGRKVTLFAYPFGGREHFTEANRALTQQAGYGCCVSAFGGTVRSGTDPFRIRRSPVSPWNLSPYHFGFETVLAHMRDNQANG